MQVDATSANAKREAAGAEIDRYAYGFDVHLAAAPPPSLHWCLHHQGSMQQKLSSDRTTSPNQMGEIDFWFWRWSSCANTKGDGSGIAERKESTA